MDYEVSRRGTREQWLIAVVHLLIEFPLWCNCIAGHSDYRRDGTQVTALDRVPLSLQPEGPPSRHRVDEAVHKSSPELPKETHRNAGIIVCRAGNVHMHIHIITHITMPSDTDNVV